MEERQLSFADFTISDDRSQLAARRARCPLSSESTAEQSPARLALWQTIYGEQPGYLALFSGFRLAGRLTQPVSAYVSWPQQADRADAWITREAARQREVYQCAHLLARPQRRKVAALPVSSLWVDLDHADLSPVVPPPSVVVESSPGRLQAYWRLAEPVAPAQAEVANRCLARVLGADMGGWDLTQLLRVPGTRNYKYPHQPQVRVLGCTDDRYHLADLVELSVQPERLPSPPTLPGPRSRLSPAARRVVAGETVKRKPDGAVDRSVALVQIARVLYEAGMAREVLVAALAERDTTLGWHKYSERPDAAEQYHRIVDVIERGARTQRRPQ